MYANTVEKLMVFYTTTAKNRVIITQI